jgi:hypothetical protein
LGQGSQVVIVDLYIEMLEEFWLGDVDGNNAEGETNAQSKVDAQCIPK